MGRFRDAAVFITGWASVFHGGGFHLVPTASRPGPGMFFIQSMGPNSACDVRLLLELTSGLRRDRGESGGLRGVLVPPARHRVKLGSLSTGFVGSGHMLVGLCELCWRGESGGHQGHWRTLRVQMRVVVKIFGRAVGCSTELTGSDEDKGALLEGGYSFHGKIVLRRANQNNGARGCEK